MVLKKFSSALLSLTAVLGVSLPATPAQAFTNEKSYKDPKAYSDSCDSEVSYKNSKSYSDDKASIDPVAASLFGNKSYKDLLNPVASDDSNCLDEKSSKEEVTYKDPVTYVDVKSSAEDDFFGVKSHKDLYNKYSQEKSLKNS